MRRYRVLAGWFDTRAHFLGPAEDRWEDTVKAQHEQSRERVLNGVRAEFGAHDFDRKAADFQAIGPFPFSVISYHNALFAQARNAFVQGSYYPALLAACALGERTLNHLILDLRDDFSHTPEHGDVAQQASWSNWGLMIRTLIAWSIIDDAVAALFKRLSGLRHRAVHFRAGAYVTMREDALAAIETMREIIAQQFGSFGPQRWYIPGTPGVCFVQRAFENDPFVRRFILPTAVYVGPLHGTKADADGDLQFIDWPPEHYGNGELTDDEYRNVFNNRDPAACASFDSSP